jgi:hypothetical protein
MADLKFPSPPTRQRDSWSFPNDLVQSNRRFYTQINLVDYNAGMLGGGWSSSMSSGGTIRLPIPRRLNDNEFNMWQEWSLTQEAWHLVKGISAARGGSGIVAGIADFDAKSVSTITGLSINPFMFMMYKRPTFKEHTFSWTLAPNNAQESETIKKIVNALKKAALPTPVGFAGALMKYPKLAMVRFMPDTYLYKLKPCAIVSVQVDYNGSGIPSFFKDGAPTVVNLSVQLKEIELWNTENYEE